MISVAEAIRIIKEYTHALAPKMVSVRKAVGMVLAEDISAPIDLPSFPQSSMDGYAFQFGDWKPGSRIRLSGEIAAGSPLKKPLKKGTAVRIFTGGALPEGADTVVIQEKATQEPDGVIFRDENIRQGSHVRPRGMEIKKGASVLKKGSMLNPAAIGLLASLGIDKLFVYPKPRISIIITGNELIEPGNPLYYGQVYDSNSFFLPAALTEIGLSTAKCYYVEDSLKALSEKLGKALEKSDLVLLSGGISVGKYDFVLQACQENGIEPLFHRIKQRPAKPLYFGKLGSKFVFGLPGNPASGLTSYYLYVLPAIAALMKKELSLKQIRVPLSGPYKKEKGLTHFLKGFYNGHQAVILEGQESFRLSSFSKSNCLIQIEEEDMVCEEGQLVTIHLLP